MPYEVSDNMLPRSVALYDDLFMQPSLTPYSFASLYCVISPFATLARISLIWRFGEFRKPLAFPPSGHAVTFDSIARVLFGCANFQVIGSYTRRLIAFMTDEQT